GPCPGGYNVPAALHQRGLCSPPLDPHGTRPLLRDLSGKGDGGSKGEHMHVDTAHHIPMPHKGAEGMTATPHAPAHVLLPPADRTLARCARSEAVKCSMRANLVL